jgi:hypothetical protein
MSSGRVEVCCICCNQLGRHNGRGLRHTCYRRHRQAGTLNRYPRLNAALPHLWRLQEYRELQARGLNTPDIAQHMNVSTRTIERYAAKTRTETAA